MAEKKAPRNTRRAERRRAQKARERDDADDSGEDESDQDESDQDESDQEESDQDEPDASEQGDDEPEREETEERQPNRRERRAQRARGAEIRDRNQRMRQEAVEKRRAKRARERAQAAAEGLDTSELVDDALARGADTATKLVKRHFKWIQWLVVGGVVGGFAWLIYEYRQDLANQKNSKVLMQALRTENAVVKGSEPNLELQQQSGFVDTRPEFESNRKRWAEAKREYEAVIKGDPSPARQELARLGMAGVQFEQGKYKEAKALFEQVEASALAGTDRDVRGRALEGVGLCFEAMKKPEEATKAFKELENVGAARFKVLAQYHRARLLYAQGKTEDAKKILVKALEKLDKQERPPNTPPGFVEVASRQLLEAIDPSTAQQPASGITPEQLEKLKKQLEAAQRGKDVADLLKSMGDPQPAPTDQGSEPDEGGEDEADSEAATPVPEPAPAPQGTAPAPTKPAPAPAKPAPVAPTKKPAAPAPAQPAPAPKAPSPAPQPAAPQPAAPPAPQGAPTP